MRQLALQIKSSNTTVEDNEQLKEMISERDEALVEAQNEIMLLRKKLEEKESEKADLHRQIM